MGYCCALCIRFSLSAHNSGRKSYLPRTNEKYSGGNENCGEKCSAHGTGKEIATEQNMNILNTKNTHRNERKKNVIINKSSDFNLHHIL